jgi:two-component system, OmpR family, sensor kinase
MSRADAGLLGFSALVVIQSGVPLQQDDFVSMAAHAFRALLAVIDGNAQRMIAQASDLTGTEVVDRAQRIRGAVRSMTQLVDDLVGSRRSQVQVGGIRYHPAEIDLSRLLTEVCDLQRELTPEAQIRCAAAVGKPVRIWGDETLLRQAFGNIVANAVRYSPGGPVVDVSVKEEEATASVIIEDQGIGIPGAERQRVFDAYFRCSNATSIEGHGLGLYIVKKLVDLHQGTVTVGAGDGGAGSRFVVRLPVAIS